MIEEVYVTKINHTKTNKENKYKVIMKSRDDNIKIQIKVDADDWEDFQSEHSMDVNAILVFELRNPQTKITKYSGEES